MCKNIQPEKTNFWIELSAVSDQRSGKNRFKWLLLTAEC
jgi:hypothetical protein